MLFAVLLALILLGGCSQSTPTPDPVIAPPVEYKSTQDTRPVIVAFGDSLTAGFGLDPELSYPSLLQEQLPAYRFVNAGISGDTTAGGVERLASVIAHNPRLVILELGANDGLRGMPVATTRANLDKIITGLKQAGAKVLLVGITLPRNYGAAYIRDFDRMYPELAKKHDLPLLPFMLEGVAFKKDLMQGDMLHPNAAGTRIVAKNIRKALEPMLTSLGTGATPPAP